MAGIVIIPADSAARAVRPTVTAVPVASSAALTCDEDDDVAGGAESSAPQAVNAMLDAIVAIATQAVLPTRLSLFISASVFVKARAVSNPFKK